MQPSSILSFLLVCMCCVALPMGACTTPRQERDRRVGTAKSARLTVGDLRAALDDFQRLVNHRVSTTAQRIRESAKEREQRRLSLLWEMNAHVNLHQIITRNDPIHAFLQAWVFCVRNHSAVAEGEYHDAFGEFQDLVVETSADAVAEIEGVGRFLLTPEEFMSTREDVLEFAGEHPIAGTYTGPVMNAIDYRDTARDRFDDALNVTLSPLRPLQGVDRSAQAISEFTVTADRFSDIVEQWPMMLNWQFQLLLFELTEKEDVRQLLTDIRSFSTSAERVAASSEQAVQAAEDLPARVLQELDARGPQLSSALSDFRETSEKLEALVQRVQEASGTLETTALSTAQAGEAWSGTAQSIQDMVAYFVGLAKDKPEAEVEAKSGRGYDVLDYEKTAVALTEAARELRALTGDIRDLVDSDALSEKLDSTLSRTDRVTDHATWRGAQLLFLAFGLAVVYRVVFARRPSAT